MRHIPHKRFTKSILVFFFASSFLFSQTSDKPWSISLGTSIIDVYPTGLNETSPFGSQGEFLESFFNVGDHWNIGGPTISISRFVAAGLSVGLKYTLNNITKVEGSPSADYSYYNADAFFKWAPLQSKFRPFLTGGYGFSNIDIQPDNNQFFLSKNVAKTLFGGLGLAYEFTDRFDVSFQSAFRSTEESYGTDHFEHLVSFHYNFGGGDIDGDGISDKKDECPEVPGLKEFNGCPDTDEDGIIDKEDKCPEVAGLAEFNGCTDRDGDGVADPDDLCPNIAGSKELNGCLDSDGDSIIDPEDDCPNEMGLEENKGCPWPDADNDGVPDPEDKCKDQSGPASNNGCPEIATEIIDKINNIAPNIYFVADSDALIGKKTFVTLNEIIKILKTNPVGVLNIEGYASSDGSEKYNEELSLRRAVSVKNYLIQQGVSEERIITSGFGENDPSGDNETVEGRTVNRRVQFKAKL